MYNFVPQFPFPNRPFCFHLRIKLENQTLGSLQLTPMVLSRECWVGIVKVPPRTVTSSRCRRCSPMLLLYVFVPFAELVLVARTSICMKTVNMYHGRRRRIWVVFSFPCISLNPQRRLVTTLLLACVLLQC